MRSNKAFTTIFQKRNNAIIINKPHPLLWLNRSETSMFSIHWKCILSSSTMYGLLLSWNSTTKLLNYSLFKLGKQMLNKETKIPRGREKMAVPSESTSSFNSFLVQEILFHLLWTSLILTANFQKQCITCFMLLATSSRSIQNRLEL